MRYITATLLYSLCATTLFPLGALANEPAPEIVMPLAPPPGPYVSSRPILQPTGSGPASNNYMPFSGQMPVPNAPMRFMPYPRQMPSPQYWWYGPVRR